MQGGVHPTSGTLRLYVNRGELGIRDIILVGIDRISEYTIRDMLQSEYRQQPPPEKNSWKHRKSASPYTTCTTAKVCEEWGYLWSPWSLWWSHSSWPPGSGICEVSVQQRAVLWLDRLLQDPHMITQAHGRRFRVLEKNERKSSSFLQFNLPSNNL